MVNVSEAALKYFESKKINNLYVEIVKGGCSGMQYKFYEIEDKEKIQNKKYEEIKIKNVNILIDMNSFLFIIGTTLDYEKTSTGTKLIFKNPNESYQCGCGKSFNV